MMQKEKTRETKGQTSFAKKKTLERETCADFRESKFFEMKQKGRGKPSI
jgi:hypothetical protein